MVYTLAVRLLASLEGNATRNLVPRSFRIPKPNKQPFHCVHLANTLSKMFGKRSVSKPVISRVGFRSISRQGMLRHNFLFFLCCLGQYASFSLTAIASHTVCTIIA